MSGFEAPYRCLEVLEAEAERYTALLHIPSAFGSACPYVPAFSILLLLCFNAEETMSSLRAARMPYPPPMFWQSAHKEAQEVFDELREFAVLS